MIINKKQEKEEFSNSSVGKESACNAGDLSLIPRSGRFPEEGIGYTPVLMGFAGGSESKQSTCTAGDLGSIPGLGRSPGEGHGNPLKYLLPGESPWRGEPGVLQSMGSQRLRHQLSN